MQLRVSRTAYLASAGVVGTVVVESSESGDQSAPAEVAPASDAPAQSESTTVEASPVVESEPPKMVFADLPEKVPFVPSFFPFLSVPSP